MLRPSPLRMTDIICEDQNKKQQDFLRNTEEFPCLFNLGKCKLDTGNRKYTGIGLHVLDVSKNKWQSLLEDLNNDSKVSECDKEVWKDNLLTYVYAELGKYVDAFKLNRKIQDQHGRSNLVALVNAAFLFYKTGNLREACRILDELKTLKSKQSFIDLKIDAICELSYAFCKLAGAKNLQFSISFLEFALLFCPHDEQMQLMLAIVYRRCCHFHIYSADPEKINRHDFALKAANILSQIGTNSKNTSFKAAALIELAFLKYEDHVCNTRNNNGKYSILSPEEWFQVVQDRTWKELCEEAIEACEDGPSEKVLKIAGQLFRYYSKDDESLEKSVQLLKRAIAKKSSNRAHHHLGLTYRKMAACHEQKYNMNQKYSKSTRGGYNVITGRQKLSNVFGNNTGEIKNTSRGYHQQGFNFNYTHVRNTHQLHQHTEYVNDGYVRNDCYNKHTNREHHRQGFTSRSDNNNHNIFENSTEGACGHRLQVLPVPSVNNTPQTPEKHLKCIVKVPDQFKSFSKGNPYIGKAVHHLQQAVEISCHQNKVAVYDLACILVQAEDYKRSKEMCRILIKECTTSETLTFDPVYLVNAYNLYGICCAKEAEAEVNQVNKEWLANECDQYLTLAVIVASSLASTVPELEMCATDLWNAFRTLQKKFKFEGQKDSRDKLYKLCEFISDYRYLEAVDDIISQDPEELKKIEVMEQCLQRYLNMKAYDSALLFRNLIILQPEVKAKLSKSKVYKQLMLEVAEGKLEKMYLEGNTEACDAYPVWKQLFNDEFIVANRYARRTYHVKLKKLINKMKMRHTNRGHHCQGFTSQSYLNKYAILENNTKGAEGHKMQVLPEPPVNKTPQTPYNLYGICCANEAKAEVNQESKERLADKSEQHLTLAIRLPSYLAATVPELEMCANDLWNTFTTLENKFKCEGDISDKLNRLCKYINNHRYLEAVDKICSQDPERLKKMEIIEQCLLRFLNMKACDSTLIFRDTLILQPEVKAKLPESKVYKQVMLEVAVGKLEKMYLEGNTEACHANPTWKQLFNDKFIITGNSKKYDIVIVSDVDDDYELKRGMMFDIAQHLKRVLETFGPNVVLAHEEGLPGRVYLEEQLNIISNSRVSIFVLTDPCMGSLSLVSEVADLRISESEPPLPESTTVIQDSSNCCTPEGAVADGQHENEHSVSPLYERIISASISNFHNVTCNASRVIFVVPDSLKHEDLPQAARGLPNIALTRSEIETLTALVPGNSNEQCINLMKKIFRAVLRKCQV